ncbi:hypothetical protein A7A08_02770 [Methyloligella halotolerans]|uniref:Uncharacterized protein n=1 Tax=Methyloligella halotolerans TaxID=1177755 RepID=A0A1E2RW38_9HYPH|nr:hypothetical protein [Methyloligella halotolerans]ODA66372.1 hypothetical protein A7A08_02770 [Methyloligella halotolerans]
MVEAEKVKNAMHNEMRDVILWRNFERSGFPSHRVETENDVAEGQRVVEESPSIISAGKERTLVGLSWPRKSRFKPCTAASSSKTIATS